MKHYVVITFLVMVALLVGGPLSAATLELISQSYHIGPGGGTSTTPISGVVWHDYYNEPWEAATDGNLDGASAFVSALVEYAGEASATISFMARGASYLDVTASIWNLPVTEGYCQLVDDTSGSLLFRLDNPFDYYEPHDASIRVSVTPGHTYTIITDVQGTADPIIAWIGIEAVPEPSTLLLLGAGLSGLLFVRRRFRN